MLPVKEFRLKNISVLTWLFGLEEPFPLEEDQLPSFLSLQSSFHWRENTRSERLRSIQWFKAYKKITEAYNQPSYLLIMVIKDQLTIINVLYITLIIFHRRSDYKINKHLYALSFQIMCVSNSLLVWWGDLQLVDMFQYMYAWRIALCLKEPVVHIFLQESKWS